MDNTPLASQDGASEDITPTISPLAQSPTSPSSNYTLDDSHTSLPHSRQDSFQPSHIKRQSAGSVDEYDLSDQSARAGSDQVDSHPIARRTEVDLWRCSTPRQRSIYIDATSESHHHSHSDISPEVEKDTFVDAPAVVESAPDRAPDPGEKQEELSAGSTTEVIPQVDSTMAWAEGPRVLTVRNPSPIPSSLPEGVENPPITNGSNEVNGTKGTNAVDVVNRISGINGTNRISGIKSMNSINGTNGANGVNRKRVSTVLHTAQPTRTSPEVQENKEEKQEHRLIIGVDFGTTYSGVATVYTGNPEDVEIIKSWPGGNGITSDKVPTEIAYPKPTTPNTPPQSIHWGFQFRPEERRIRCIKLFLDRNQKLPSFVSPLDTASQLRASGRTVMDAVSDYLTQLMGHTMEQLVRRYGRDFMRSVEKEYVLTVPAVWSDAAKHATLQAAERAGMGRMSDIRMISEPEAAALYTLKSVQTSGVKVGDNYVVCDAGGGTVDLIAYKVKSIAPLRIEESAVGTGALCGSAFLNYRFEDHVRSRIGVERYTHMRERKPKTWMMGLKYFEESVKRNFNIKEHAEVNVPFPGLPDDEEAGLDSGFLTMTAEQVKSIFDPVIDEIVGLLEGQISDIEVKGGSVSGIILVGGFGQSNYLYETLKQHFAGAGQATAPDSPIDIPKDVSYSGIQVMQPLYAWTAVVRGAVLRGLEGSMVTRRRSRRYYGTSYATVFDASKHAADDKYWSPLWERWMVSDRMQWHLSKGTLVASDTPISFHYTRNFRSTQSLIVEDELIACDADVAPDHFARGLATVCNLKTDLSAVPRKLFTRLTTSSGIEFDNLDFELQMKIESANLVFELRVGGVKYGSVQAEFH